MNNFNGLIIAGVIFLLAIIVHIALKRTIWSPLKHIPGPKLASLTQWYEFYFDVIKGGQYIWEIKRLHNVYGPVIRINPNEIHISNPDFYDEIYTSSSRKSDKYAWQVKSGDSAQAMGFTVSHDLHRLRRQAVDRAFSTRSIQNLEPVIQHKIAQLCRLCEQHRSSRAPLNLTLAFLALSMDIIQDYAFGLSSNLLDQLDESDRWRDTITGIMSKTALLNHCGWIPKILRVIPDPIVDKCIPNLAKMQSLKRRIKSAIENLPDAFPENSGNVLSRRTFFHEILDDKALPASEKTADRLTDEATILIIAASESPAKVLAFIMFHLMRKPEIWKRARDELNAHSVTAGWNPTFCQLEHLPYLSAIIKEGLRLHGGVVARSSRVHPEALMYEQLVIPPRTPVSSSQSRYISRTIRVFARSVVGSVETQGIRSIFGSLWERDQELRRQKFRAGGAIPYPFFTD